MHGTDAIRTLLCQVLVQFDTHSNNRKVVLLLVYMLLRFMGRITRVLSKLLVRPSPGRLQQPNLLPQYE